MTNLGLPFEQRDLAIFVVVFLAVVSYGMKVVSGKNKSRSYKPRRDSFRPRGEKPRIPVSFVPGNRPIDPAEQLRAVMAPTFEKQRVLSRTEARVMDAADQAIAEAGLKWRVMAQVALGEVIKSSDEAAFFAINAKRVDLLIMSEHCEPLAAIEYQGQGHYQGTAPARDAIKKEALRKAGIAYIEITYDHGPEDVRREIGRLAFTLARNRGGPKSNSPAAQLKPA